MIERREQAVTTHNKILSSELCNVVTIDGYKAANKVLQSVIGDVRPMNEFLEPSDYVDSDHPKVVNRAKILSRGSGDPVVVAKACFEFVRDEIRHSWDFQLNPVTCRASDVLKYGTGYCYAKSHLLAALLRANQYKQACAIKG